MGTNENVNNTNGNIINPEIFPKNATAQNTSRVTDNTIVVDFQATQRIDILSELTKMKEQQAVGSSHGSTMSQNVIVNNKNMSSIDMRNKETVNILNSSSDNSAEQIAQSENSSNTDLLNENVLKTPKEIIEQSNISNTSGVKQNIETQNFAQHSNIPQNLEHVKIENGGEFHNIEKKIIESQRIEQQSIMDEIDELKIAERQNAVIANSDINRVKLQTNTEPIIETKEAELSNNNVQEVNTQRIDEEVIGEPVREAVAVEVGFKEVQGFEVQQISIDSLKEQIEKVGKNESQTENVQITQKTVAESKVTARLEAVAEPKVTANPGAVAELEVTANPEVAVEPEVTTELEIEVKSEVVADPEITPKLESTVKQEVETKPEVTAGPEAIREENANVKDNDVKSEVIETEKLADKEKQHAQDKKDYRLERMLFDRINTMQGKIKESLELIEKFERINAKEENLPNIVTTLHDKLTHEVIKQFRTVGIEFNMKSYLVQSVVSDLLAKFEEGITEFRDCSENLNFVREVQDDFESRVEIAQTSKVKNIFARLRGMFKPERKQERLEELERERQKKKLDEANIHLMKYKLINSELEKYTIKDNIVESLNREIMHGQGSGQNLSVTDFVSEKIALEMKKLGLESLLPNLLQSMYDEYKQKDMDIAVEDFAKMQVGELRRNMKARKVETLKSKVETVITCNNGKATVENDERMVV